MPFTPFHLGPALFFGLILLRYVNFPTFIASSIVLDIEGLLVLLLNLDYPLHGFFHSFLGGSVVAVFLAFLMVRMNGRIQRIVSPFKLGQKYSGKNIWLASFAGVFLHIVLDAPLYPDMMPFFPLTANPFYGISPALEVYGLCVILLLAGAGLYLYRISRRKTGKV